MTINSDDAADYDTWKSANLSTINGYDKIVYVGNYSSFSALEDDITVPVIDVTDAILAGGSGMEQGGVKTLTNSNIKCVIYASGGNYQQITGITPDATLTEYVLIDTNTSTATALFNNSVTFWSNTIEAAATHFDKLVMTGSLANSDAITVASGFDGKTLNMENLTTTSAFTFANADIKRVILPDYWDKTAVRAAAEAIINGDGNIAGNSRFEAALSQHGPMHNYGKDNPNEPATLIAYVQQPGTLYAAVDEILPGGNKMGKKNAGAYYDMKLVKYVSIMGYPSARDFSNGALTFYTADGHFRFNEEADETSNTADTGVSGNTRTLTGSYTLDGALNGVEGLISLDLGDAIIYDQWCEDITFGYNNVLGDGTKEVIFPTCSELTIIPADCLSGGGLNSLEEICIPGNIRTIKTRAFNSSAQALCHIWTTGTDPDVKYDNGAYLLSDQSTVDHYDHAPLNSTTWNCKASFNSETTGGVPRYGTITLPPNLELIESNAFSCEHVSDVYVLTATAPECHVDAFSSVMYLGNNTINSQSKVTADGMVTRDAYCVNPNNGTFISMLHYPVETTTPDLQRYTDPTREYHVATTLRDDNGNIIYFPNQSELNRAYWQGTTGYLWNAWNPERVPNGNNENSFVHEMGNISQWRHTTGYQTAANTLWEENPGTTVDKTDRSFYDVRLGTGEQPVLAQPTGLDWYYNTVWEEQYLYPKIDYTDGSTVVTQIQETDQQGNPVYYEDTNNEGCNYVEDYSYEQDNNGSLVENINVDTNGDKVRDYTWTLNPTSGEYVHEITVTEDPNGTKVLDYAYVENAQGTYYHPLVSRNYDGNKPKPWYSMSQQQVADQNGDYIWTNSIGDQYNYIDCTTWLTWNHTEEELAEKRTNGWTFNIIEVWSIDNNSGTHYISEGYAEYSASVTDYIVDVNDTRYNKVYSDSDEYRDYDASTDDGETRYNVTDNGYRAYAGTTDDEAGYKRYDKVYASTLRDYDATTDAGETRYTVGTGYRAYDSSIDDPDSWLQRYKKDYNGTYREYDASIDDAGETRYCPSMVDVYNMVKSDTHDYRGWHQFVLTAYSNNSHETTTTVRFYQTDNDWWTVCLPYDLKHSEMVKFFGKESTGAIPYLSKLQYVVRDYDKGKITLMFSNNLMEYKEVVDTDNDQVHGTIDNSTRYTTEELEADPVILHAGVPYLIRPNIDVNASRSFTVAQEDNADLYNRLHNAQSLDATALNTLIYHGEYTVPAYVVGANTEEGTTNSKTIANKDGFSQTYTPGDITYGGQTVTAEVSSAYTYTFVGTFFISRLPQYCYFLGWVGPYETGHAAFWYNRVTTDDYNWNNQTGIICPNFDTNLTIYAATSVADPARWIIGASDIGNDDLLGEVGGGNSANSTSAMDFGGSLPGQATGIKEVSTQTTAKADRGVVYNTNGQVVRTDGDLQGLTKGVYIVNGKKYVVK